MKNLYHAMATASLVVILFTLALVEIRWHAIERFVGSYMDFRNESRDRLERFVDQEIRTNEALEYANELIEQRSQETEASGEESGTSRDRSAPGSEIVRLDRGHKLIMTRERFLDGPNWFVGAARSIPSARSAPSMQSAHSPPAAPTDSPAGVQRDPLSMARPDSLSGEQADTLARLVRAPGVFEPDSLKSWTRTVAIRPGWIRKGEVYMVDDDNYILHRMPITVEQFNLIDAYTTAAEEGRLDEDMEHVFRPRKFFNTLRSLDTEMRDEIIDPMRFRDLETTAQRIGVSENQRIIQIERLVDGRVDVVTIPVSADLFIELYVALGAI